MRVVLQRVRWARVRVDDEEVAAIGPGLLALVAVGTGDGPDEARRLAHKTARLRLFAEGERPFNLSLAEVGGELLCVSQFTLMGDVRRGNRPSWARAADPESARALVDLYAEEVRACGAPVRLGRFGAIMDLELLNHGPVTIVLDSDELASPRRARGRPEELLP